MSNHRNRPPLGVEANADKLKKAVDALRVVAKNVLRKEDQASIDAQLKEWARLVGPDKWRAGAAFLSIRVQSKNALAAFHEGAKINLIVDEQKRDAETYMRQAGAKFARAEITSRQKVRGNWVGLVNFLISWDIAPDELADAMGWTYEDQKKEKLRLESRDREESEQRARIAALRDDENRKAKLVIESLKVAGWAEASWGSPFIYVGQDQRIFPVELPDGSVGYQAHHDPLRQVWGKPEEAANCAYYYTSQEVSCSNGAFTVLDKEGRLVRAPSFDELRNGEVPKVLEDEPLSQRAEMVNEVLGATDRTPEEKESPAPYIIVEFVQNTVRTMGIIKDIVGRGQVPLDDVCVKLAHDIPREKYPIPGQILICRQRDKVFRKGQVSALYVEPIGEPKWEILPDMAQAVLGEVPKVIYCNGIPYPVEAKFSAIVPKDLIAQMDASNKEFEKAKCFGR